jgi:hypothetical protein
MLPTVDRLKKFMQMLAEEMNADKAQKGKYIPSELTMAVYNTAQWVRIFS